LALNSFERLPSLTRRLLVAFIAGLLLFVVALAGRRPYPAAEVVRADTTDFGAFYCAAKVALEHHDPYLVEPLRSCEQALEHSAGWASSHVTPAPFPSYSVAFFAPLTALDFQVARILYVGILLIALMISAAFLAELARIPTLAALAAVMPTLGFLNLELGEPTPIVVAALCVAAYLVSRDRHEAAGLAAALAMLQPQIGLPAVLALFLWLPRTRTALACAGIAFAAVGLALVGPDGNVEYFRRILPAQATAELAVNDQYSLSRVLYLVGASPSTALAAGSLCFAVMTALGVFLARTMRDDRETLALVVLLPTATALLGGSYVHDDQIAAALPAAILLARLPSAWRILGWTALALLALRFTVPNRIDLVWSLLAAVVIGALAIPRAQALARVAATLALPIAYLLAVHGLQKAPHRTYSTTAAMPQVSVRPSDPAPVPWGLEIRSEPSRTLPDVRQEVEKLPAWLGVMFIILCAARSAVERIPRRHTVSAVPIDIASNAVPYT
jgi:hypothetical protein